MRREWEPEDLIAAWTLLDGDWELLANKAGATRLGFALLLKFFEQEARFPRHAGELPKAAVDYVAGQVKVDPGLLAGYDWAGRSIERHRAQIRKALGFRESTRADEDALIEWLAAEICPMVLTDEGVRAAMLARCRKLKIEPPGRSERILGGCRLGRLRAGAEADRASGVRRDQTVCPASSWSTRPPFGIREPSSVPPRTTAAKSSNALR